MASRASNYLDSKSQTRGGRALIYISGPVGVLCLLFIGPMAVLFYISIQNVSLGIPPGFAGLANYLSILEDPGYRKVALDTVFIATVSMTIMLVLAIPLAYVLAFRMKRFELHFLLLLVLADQLNPLIKIYAWRILLGRDGIINSFLLWTGLASHPLDALLFSKLSVIIVLSGTYISYAAIPIYAALKAVDSSLIDAASDLGAGLVTIFRKILLPLASPGIFVALILVYIPLYSEFVTPSLVGGTSGYMFGNAIQDQMLQIGDWGVGSAMSFMLLLLSVLLAVVAYRLARVRRLETAS
jgi:spermidine/putrescine transport system permease protein